MTQLAASNLKSDEVSGSEEFAAREGLDEIAAQQYAKALDLQRKGKLPEAIQLLKDLLGKQILLNVNKPVLNRKVKSSLFFFKYLCYKNLAAMLSEIGEVEAAIASYVSASEIKDNDVTLWLQLGLLYICVKSYEPALDAFKRGWACNERYWPCIDKVLTLLLGLELEQECIAAIYKALQLDPCYLRGLAYRRYIYAHYEIGQDYQQYYDYDDVLLDEEKAEKLLKEADEITIYIKQQKEIPFKHEDEPSKLKKSEDDIKEIFIERKVEELKLKIPITRLSWKAVGDALVDMYSYMTRNYSSIFHPLEIMYNIEEQEEMQKMDVFDTKHDVIITGTKKNIGIVLENVNNNMSDTDKPVTNIEKLVSVNESRRTLERYMNKTSRHRRSDLSHIQQLELCNHHSDPKNPTVTTTYKNNDSIYDLLRKMIPLRLVSQLDKNKEKQVPLQIPVVQSKTFEEVQEEVKQINNVTYFSSVDEEIDVKLFINKYSKEKHVIINILHDYLAILARLWRFKWPKGLVKVFIETNKCYNNHVDIPACTDENKFELIHYTSVNLLVEELIVNDKLNSNIDDNGPHDLSVVETIGNILSVKPDIFSRTDCLNYMLRQMWVRFHIHKLNKCESLEPKSQYGLANNFHALNDFEDTYSLNVVNFTYKPVIDVKKVKDSIIFTEVMMKVNFFYDKGYYDEVLTILNSYLQHFKTLAVQQDNILSLEFSVYLSIILDIYEARDKEEGWLNSCFTCLHVALKHYFRYTSGSADYEKWTRTVLKILSRMEHILSTKGLSSLDAVTGEDLSEGLEDLIKIIGHQVETNATEMPLDTVAPWIIMYYILQREEDQGRGTASTDHALFDYVPYPLMVLFIGHAKLGKRQWCTKSDGKLLYFILDTVVPRLRSPSLSKCLEMVSQYMEQCVFCLFGYHGPKTKYFADHKATPKSLDWHRAQQLYDIFRPTELPELEGKVSAITADTESLFLQILALLPPECDPHKYVAEMEKYMEGIEDKLPVVPSLLPPKMKDIYFLLGDYYFKKDKMGINYNTLDVIINNDRFESWAQIALAKALKLELLLNSCENPKTHGEFLNEAVTAIRCFRRSLDLDSTCRELRFKLGNLGYAAHSFCSRFLKRGRKQLLSNQCIELLVNQKEDMLDTTQECFDKIITYFNSSNSSEKSNEKKWLCYYMLGKVAEKRNNPPCVYLDYYMKGIKSLVEAGATYPSKIYYNSPTRLSVEVLELHYRVHASILKYIEQHENKPIQESVGKVFAFYIDEWLRGPFARRKKQDRSTDTERENKFITKNILKRPASDAGVEITTAAKVIRRESYDTERFVVKEATLHESQDIKSNKCGERLMKGTNDKETTNVLTTNKTMEIVSACLDALEDCVNHFPRHYKAIYRLAHHHFHYKKSKDIERCRNLMLATFKSRFGQELGGLFCERNNIYFFNNVCKIPLTEVDRGGSFPFHMNRSVLLTLEILKEINDHKTLFDLSLHLQKIPNHDKKYLRDSDREELAQEASLYVQSLKGRNRFRQQADLKSDDVGQQAPKTIILEINAAYESVERQPNSKQSTNLLIDGYKLRGSGPFENENLVDPSMNCQSLKQQDVQNKNLDKTKNLQNVKLVPSSNPSKPATKPSASLSSTSTTSVLPKISVHDMAAAFQNYVPITNAQLLAQQTSLQYSLHYQGEFYRQAEGQSFSPFSLPLSNKQKRAPKSGSTNRAPIGTSQMKPSKSTTSRGTSLVKTVPSPSIPNQKSMSSLAPSMGTVLPTLPASMTANLSAFGGSSHSHSSTHSTLPAQAHMASTTTVNAAMHSKPPMPHQQVSPGKTLQEKLAERQKNLPSIPKAPLHDAVSREINQSISRLPSSLTITMTSAPKQPVVVGKGSEPKKS